jgi:hypothetical protein
MITLSYFHAGWSAESAAFEVILAEHVACLWNLMDRLLFDVNFLMNSANKDGLEI